MSAPTPAELRELASRAQALAVDIDVVQQRLRAVDDEPTRRVGYRLDDAAGAARGVARDLEETAGDLARVRGRGTCRADWGVCPEHGNTLTSSGGESWCRECGRRWGYDRSGLPCAEPVTYEVRDAEGGTMRLCSGHAADARARLIGATVTALPDEGGR